MAGRPTLFRPVDGGSPRVFRSGTSGSPSIFRRELPEGQAFAPDWDSITSVDDLLDVDTLQEPQ